MNERFVVTIGRQSGSGGKEIGKILAKKLGVKCYDKELITLAAKESGLCSELIESHDEKPTSSFLYSLVMDSYAIAYNSSAYMDMPMNHKIFLAQFEAIKKLAREENCVIVGRCADYALNDDENLLSVFIRGKDEDKIKKIMNTHNVNEHKAKDYMNKTDKSRSGYYNYYANKKWGSINSYDIVIDSGILGYEGTAEVIKNMLYLKLGKQ